MQGFSGSGISRCTAGRPSPAPDACRTCRGRARRTASLARLAPSLASRLAAASSVFAAIARGTQTTPSSSATITSPGVTSMPAQTTGMFTEPSVALIVPLLLMALAPDREAHLGQRLHVAHAGVDHQGAGAARHEAGGQQVAEVAVGAFGADRGDDDVAGPDLLGHDMHHPVVARMQQHGDRRARHLRAGVDRPHVGLQQADAAHGLVHRGRTEGASASAVAAVGAGDVAIDDAQFVHVISPLL
jgi:hypothetical protein